MKYGRYEIVGELGKGSMGVIYKAHDPQIDRVIALKVLRHDRVTSEEFVKRFYKEAKAIGRLSHSAIVTIYDVGQDKGTIYIAMEFLEGSSLDGVIRERRLSPEEIVDIGAQVTEALDYAHQQGIVHRDIKPSNIILTPTGQVKITDFGIARIEDSSAPRQTLAGEILGTPLYMSPEQVMSQSVDGRSDLYSLGVILYELTTGKRPFGGDSLAPTFRAITQDTPPGPAKIDPSVSKALSKLIMKSINKLPDKRFQTGKAMAKALKACFKEEEQKRLSQQPIKERAKHVGLFALIAFIVISVTGGLFYYFMADKGPEQPPSPVSKPAPSPKTPPTDEKAERITPSTREIVSSGVTGPVGETALQALLKVESVPSGAQVFFNDSLKGETPLKLELPIGKYKVRLNLHDHHEWEAQLLLDEEGEIPLFITLLPK